MLVYGLIGLSLVLLGVTGLQFTYMFYIERLDGERKKYVKMLERTKSRLVARLEQAEARIVEQNIILGDRFPVQKDEDEAWADVIDER